MKTPYLFDEFFSSGKEETISPFLTKKSRRWGKDLSLKSASCAALLLLIAFGTSFTYTPLSLFCLSFVYFLTGAPALINALEDLSKLQIHIDVLMTLSAFAAVWLGHSLEGALLLVLFEMSGAMEEHVSKRAKSALHHLNELAPKFAHVVGPNGLYFEQALRDVSVGTEIWVRNGEIVPLDGLILEGQSLVQLSHLTGESLPIPKKANDEIPAGAKNLDAALLIKVTRTSSDSTLARIIQLITEAQEAKPSLERWLDRFSSHYATSIIALTLFFLLTLPLCFSIPYLGLDGSLYRSLAFLIAASPCALIIATPTAYLAALSACARSGILLKGGVILDALTRCQAIAFDKTGTLTSGQLICHSIEPLTPTPLSSDEALAIAASLEAQVVHPIARAVITLATAKQLAPHPLQEIRPIPGYGIEALVTTSLGPRKASLGPPSALHPRTEAELLAELVLSSPKDEPLPKERFLFHFTDPLRPNAKELIQALKTHHHLEPIMLTGDHYVNARTVGALLGIDQIFADLKPEDKLAKLSALDDQHALAMVGDGINDAPALMRATVGISMGRVGSATAIDASDVVLLNDDLHLLPWLFTKAHKTTRIVRQNLTVALLVIGLATTPALLGLLPLWLAVLLHEGGTILVGLNSLRLLKR